MSASRICLLAAALGGVLTPTASTWAQIGTAYGSKAIVDHNDLRWFEPVELDIDGQMPHRDEGWFANYDKLVWSFSGERVTIGAPDVLNPSEQIYEPTPNYLVQDQVSAFALGLGYDPVGDPDQAASILLDLTEIFGVDFTGEDIEIVVGVDDMGDDIVVLVPEIVRGTGNQPPPLYNVENGIKDALPDAGFAWGDRYEFGYSDRERGWKISILDGPQQEVTRIYGAGWNSEYTQQSITGFSDFSPDYGSTNQDLDGDGVLDAPGGVNDLYALGFGSVAVNFEAPEDFFLGFRDYMLNGYPISTIFGPTNNVNNYGGEGDEDLTLDGTEVAALVDDLNNNGGTFFVFGADLDGNGEIDDDELIGTFIDYGDLYDFDIFFNDVTVRNVTEVSGVELMATHEIDTRHKLEQGRSDQMQLAYGVRYFEMNDMFYWSGTGSILGRTYATVDIENQIVGPQLGLKWTRHDGPWDFVVDGRFMMGYNIVDRGLDGVFAQGAVPGGANKSVNARATTTVTGDRQNDFSPLAELRIGLRYRLSQALSLNVGYTGKFVDNIERASQAMRYTVPQFSLKDGKSDFLINGVNFGAELRY